MRIIYIDIDTLRPDHLGYAGYHPITPNIDALAADAHRFLSAFSSNTPCMPARASVFTGRFGASTGIETHGRNSLWIRGDHRSMLPNVLANAGVHTATVSSFGRHPAPWFYTGFCSVTDPSLCCGGVHFQRFDGRETNRHAFDQIARGLPDNLFLHLHYWDPHGPLKAPAAFVEQIRYRPDTAHISDAALQALCRSRLYRAGEHLGVHTRADLELMLIQYDAEIRYTDHLIGELIGELKRCGLYDSSMIVLASDHGEQYGEGGLLLEHGSVHDSCIRVPLLIKLPGERAVASAHNELVYTLDLAPTFADFLGAEPDADWQGRSLLPFMRGEAAPDRDYVVCDHGLYTCQRAVRTREWKLVHTYHPGVWDFPPYALYHLSEDPGECTDVSQHYPEQAERMRAWEADWLAHVTAGEPDALAELARGDGPSGHKTSRAVMREMEEQRARREHPGPC